MVFLLFLAGVAGATLWSGRHIFQVLAEDPVKTLQKQIDDLEHLKQLSIDATKPLESELDNLEGRIQSARNGIAAAKKQAQDLADSINEREEDLAIQYHLLSRRIAEQYKRNRTFSPFMTFLATQDAARLTKDLAYRSSVKAQDNRLIQQISGDITQLESDKKDLEQRQVQLAALEKQLDEQADFFRTEIAKAKDYQNVLGEQIAELSAKQKAILSARSGSYTTSVGSVPLAADYDASIAGFREKAPSGYFAAFSFGAYTHRKGMSQYGAKARAESGKKANEILKAYYGKEPVNKNTDGNIIVDGAAMAFEDHYLYGIAEMPSDWHLEALKAQAIAARTYAFRYKTQGKSICTTEACQVFNAGKANSPPADWKKAVNETKGQVLEDVTTFYSSTAGGYLTTSGWDTQDGSNNGDWTTRAWESIAGSPWFYKAWYRQSYSNSSSNCGRKPWLSPEEMADIINAWLILKKGEGGGADTSRILPVTINSCPIGGQSGGSPYSLAELRSKLSNPVTSFSGDPTATNDGQGNTTNIKFQTNRGEINIDGYQFKEVFNTRAPGYVAIPQSGFAFFNIERK